MKKTITVLLFSTLLISQFPLVSLAAESQISLTEQYLFAGRNGDWYTEESYRSSPVVTDLDGDGDLEVLNAAYSLVVMDAATGEEQWRVNAGHDRSTPYSNSGNTGLQVFSDFEVLDVDADGRKEIVVAYGNGSISVLDDQGYFKPGWPQRPTTASLRSLAVADLDLDGKQEIIVGAGIASSTSVWVYHCDGTLVSGWPQLDASQAGSAFCYGMYGDAITVGDLTGDGRPEIIFPTDTAFINAFEADGSLVAASDIYGGRAWGKISLYEDYGQEIAGVNGGWGYAITGTETRAELYRAALGHSAATYTDVDGDGISEVVVTALMTDRTTFTNTNVMSISDTRYMTVFILNQDRSRYVNEELGFDWRTPPVDLGGPLKSVDNVSVAAGVFSEPVCVDLDGDRYQEILFNSYNGKVHCFSLDGTEHGSWPFTLPKSTDTVFEFAGAPTCADLDGDGKQEVIFASWTDNDNVSSTDTGVNGALYILSDDGQLLASTDLHDGYSSYGGTISHANGVKGSPVVQDIDGDGKYEILLNTTYYALCVYEVDVPGAIHFMDVPSGTWYTDAVNWAVKNSITMGTSNTAFSPEDYCTRAQIVTFLYRAAGQPDVDSNAAAKFTDVDLNDYYAPAVAWAVEQGITVGTTDTTFSPDKECTRAQIVTFLHRYEGEPAAAAANAFTDVAPSEYYAAAVNWAVEQGITVGTTKTTFSPEDFCTRAQIVTFLYRAQ